MSSPSSKADIVAFDKPDVSSGNPAGAANPIELRQVLQLVWRRKSILIGCVLLLTTLSIIAVNRIPPSYSAGAMIMVEAQQARVFDFESVVAGVGSEEPALNSQVMVLGSKGLSQRVVERLKLIEDPEFNPLLRPEEKSAFSWLNPINLLPISWRGLFRSEKQEAPATEEKILSTAVNIYRRQLSVALQPKSYVITVGFTSSTAEKAARIANIHADEYIVNQLEAKFDATQRANSWINERLSALKQKLTTTEREAATYRARFNLTRRDGKTITAQQLDQVNAQLVAAQAKAASTSARLAKLHDMIETGQGAETVSEVLSSPLILNLRNQETEILRRLSELSNTYGELHPRIINTKRELTDLRGKIELEIRKIVRNLENEVAVTRDQQRKLTGELTRLQQEIASQNQAEIKLREIEREVNANKALYESYLSRFKETAEQQELVQPEARIISTADVPEFPSAPRKRLAVMATFAGSICLGLMLIFFMEALDHGFRSAQQLEQTINVPALGLIPQVSGPGPVQDMVADAPFSVYSESVRSLLTGLLLTRVETPPKVILITSALPGEGKTTLSLSLARTAALSGHKTVLVECDLRRPSLQRALGITLDTCFLDYLEGQSELAQSLVKDSKTGMDALVVSRAAQNPPQLLRGDRFRDLVTRLSQDYDLVILDSPPIMAVLDSLILSRYADKTVFAVQWAKTARNRAQYAIKQLTEAGADLAGVALTKVNVRRHARYGYADSGYYQGSYRKYYGNNS